MSIASEITRLQNAKAALKTAINAQNNSDHQIGDETLEDYPDFVSDINAETFKVIVVDYDGTILKQADLLHGDTFTLPTAPTPPRQTLTFDGWSSPVTITNNTVTVDDQDLIIGAMYDCDTTDFYITLDKTSGLTYSVKFSSYSADTTIDWGDNSSETVVAATTSHTYADYGDYKISIDGTSFNFDTSSVVSPKGCLTEINFSSQVTTLGSSAFNNETYLSKITMPANGMTTIKSGLFRNVCKCIVVPTGVTSFALQSHLTEYVVLPNTLTTLGSCSLGVIYISIPKSVTTINGTFYGADKLERVVYPSTLSSVNIPFWFSGFNLKKIKFPTTITTVNSSSGDYVQAFLQSYSLESITLPSYLTEIGEEEFLDCTSLKNVNIQSSTITKIDTHAFQNCTTLKNITLPNSITQILQGAFDSCYSLETITLPSSLTTLGSSVFNECWSLNDVTIPNGVTSIGNNTFDECHNLKTIVMPSGLTSLNVGAFLRNYSLQTLDFSNALQIPTLSGAMPTSNMGNYKIIVPDSLYTDWKAATYWSDVADRIYPASGVEPEPTPTPTAETYLTFSSPNSFTLQTANTTANWDGTLEYSTDKTNWSTWNGTSISSASDGTNHNIYLRGINNTYITGNANNKQFTFPTGSNISCSGNIENLLDYATVAQDNHPTMANYCFRRWLYQCTKIVDCSNLILGALVLSDYCYTTMFYQCSNLITAPSLPATTLSTYCYGHMFYECTSLTSAPSLPATTIQYESYQYMFYGCSSLTTAPSLPATTLDYRCYDGMFFNCTNLTTIPALPATTLAQWCYSAMFQGCSKIKLSTTQIGEYVNEYRIPSSGTGTYASDWNNGTFNQTGGTFTSNPSINTTYYTSNTVV